MQQKWYKTKAFTIFLHVIVWAAFILLPYFLRSNTEPVPPPSKSNLQQSILLIRHSFWLTVLFNAFNIAIFYLNAFFLIPVLLNKKKPVLYIIVTALTLILFSYIMYIMRLTIIGKPFVWRFPVFSFFNLLFFLTISITYRFLIDRNRFEKNQREKETENLKTELSFLRSQVSPHFMFNVLNNIVALSRTQPSLVEPALIQLSQLMRYMLYESNEEKVTLLKEIEYLRNYIQLQEMRFGEDVQIELNVDIDDENHHIEPMLLIPFVENAFKHGVGLIESPHIKINIRTEDTKLHFEVCNRFCPNSKEVKDKHSGIGLQNVKRRLNLLYPALHKLSHTEKDNYYCMNLILVMK